MHNGFNLLTALCLLLTWSAQATPDTPTNEPAPGSCAVLSKLSPWRYSPSVTLLRNGEVLIAGGRQHDMEGFMKAANLFAPRSRTLRPAAPLSEARAMHGAAVAGDGRVVVAGGLTKGVEVYDPAADQWSKVGALEEELVDPILVTLPSGNVLIAGGNLLWHDVLSSKAFSWRTQERKLVPIAPLPEEGASGELVVKLPDGRVGIGVAPTLAWSMGRRGLKVRELLYDEKAGWSRGTVRDPVIKAMQKDDTTATLLRPTSKQGPALRLTDDGIQALDAKSGRWREVARFAEKQPGATAVMLDEDTALVAGGLDEDTSRVLLCTLTP